jgi:hypothetical protein
VVDIDERECEWLVGSLGSVDLALEFDESDVSAVRAGELIDGKGGSLSCREPAICRCGVAIVGRLAAVTSSALTVSLGSRAVGRCCGVIRVGDSLAGLGALVASVRLLVARLGYAVMRFGSAVAILSTPVPILASLICRLETVAIVATRRRILVDRGQRD